MASISVPCPKCSVVVPPNGSRLQNYKQQQGIVSISASSGQRLSLLAGSSRPLRLQVPSRKQCTILKAQANEVAVESSSNSSPKSSTKLEAQSSDGKDAELEKRTTPQAAVSDSTISAFMTEVSDLVKLVDSKDIIELQLKQIDCELIIRKKEALPQPPLAAPAVMMQAPPQAMLPLQSMVPYAAPPAPRAPVPLPPVPALPSPAKTSQSSLPPLKCPMAGTFYCNPAPGEPPFVKVGDKVQKGQVVCIIEAMKLMNEIEADQSGTIIEILAEDGKPVSVDMPLLVIQP